MTRPTISALAACLAAVAAILPLRPVSAQDVESYMVVEAYSGKILAAGNSSVKRPIASLTKLATAAVAIDWASAAERDPGTTIVTVPDTIGLVGGPNPMALQPGDQLTLRDALYSALLGSDNLAALCIADHVGREIVARRQIEADPVATFVGEMNHLGKGLGMTSTRFANPHGLERPGAKAYSTAADVARLSIYALRRNAINFIVRQKDRQVAVSDATGKRTYTVRNTNELIGEPGYIGVKTGTTAAAGPCLAAAADREPLVRLKPDGTKGATPRRIVAVVLNSPDRFNRARALVNQGWAVYDPWIDAGAPVQDREREFLSLPTPQ